MACSKCKKQKQREEVLAEVIKVEKKIKIFFFIILALGLYGLGSILISLFN